MTDKGTPRPKHDSETSGVGASARQRAIDTYGSARDSVAGAGRRATEGIEDAPLIALAGGLAAGALIAALLPRTDAETRALRPVGQRIRGTARNAAQAAKEAGLNAPNLSHKAPNRTQAYCPLTNHAVQHSMLTYRMVRRPSQCR